MKDKNMDLFLHSRIEKKNTEPIYSVVVYVNFIDAKNGKFREFNRISSKCISPKINSFINNKTDKLKILFYTVLKRPCNFGNFKLKFMVGRSCT